MRKSTHKRLAVGSFVLIVISLCWIIYVAEYDRGWLIDVRTALFSDYTSDRNTFSSDPDQLIKMGFLKDDPGLSEVETKRISIEVDYIKNALTNESLLHSDHITKAKKIALLYSRNGGPGCGTHVDLVDQFRRLPKGYGCCSDHSQAFIALSSMLGLEAREVHTSLHTFNEFYDYEKGRWIWIDTQYAILAQNNMGEYLSLLEIRDLYMNEERVNFVFFGSDVHLFSNRSPYTHRYYANKKAFYDISVTRGNNVLEQDIIDREYSYVPKFIRQFFGITLGKYPRYLSYVDDNAKTAQIHKRNKYYYLTAGGLIIIFGIISVSYPVRMIFYTRNKK
ncbi:MAG: hypothetical protein A7315_02100 [Candidatus Altiarchaeales archaeon WOR_SM1_79]|nr:MAG: hypothetical protein A7315_02100 [Candidatus Altiarchaeales archaeon WOR_SM1_79]